MNKTLLSSAVALIFGGQLAQAQSCTDVCAAVGLNSSFEWIQAVSVGTLTNFSGNDNGYADFGDFSNTFTAGTTIPYSVVAGYGDGPFSESWKAWMDFNQDGDFDDPGEEIFTNFGQFQLSGTFFIPATAFNGSTKLRIAMGFGSFPMLCEDVSDGEIEDYCVTIVGGVNPPDLCNTDTPVSDLATTITSTDVVLTWSAVPASVGCRVSGGLLGDFSFNKNIVSEEITFLSIPLSKFNPGTYNWKVVCACEIGNPLVTTPESNVETFTIGSGISTVGGQAGEVKVSLGPNPTSAHLNLVIESGMNQTQQVTITDLLGRTVMQQDVDVTKGMNTIALDVSSLTTGTYLLVVYNGNNAATTAKFIKN